MKRLLVTLAMLLGDAVDAVFVSEDRNGTLLRLARETAK